VTIETLGLAIILSFIFFLWHKNLIALGILIGGLTGAGCFNLLARDILNSSFLDLKKINPYFFLKYLIRYAIMGVVLFLSARINLKFFFGAAGGLLLIYLITVTVALRNSSQCKTQLR